MLITSGDVFAVEKKCCVIVDPARVVIVTETAFEFAARCGSIFGTVNADLRLDSVDLKIEGPKGFILYPKHYVV
jgi:hypothetical protein